MKDSSSVGEGKWREETENDTPPKDNSNHTETINTTNSEISSSLSSIQFPISPSSSSSWTLVSSKNLNIVDEGNKQDGDEDDKHDDNDNSRGEDYDKIVNLGSNSNSISSGDNTLLSEKPKNEGNNSQDVETKDEILNKRYSKQRVCELLASLILMPSASLADTDQDSTKSLYTSIQSLNSEQENNEQLQHTSVESNTGTLNQFMEKDIIVSNVMNCNKEVECEKKVDAYDRNDVECLMRYLNPLYEAYEEIHNLIYEEEVLVKNEMYEEEIIVKNILYEDINSIYPTYIHLFPVGYEQEQNEFIATMRLDLQNCDSMIPHKNGKFSGKELVDWIMDHSLERFDRMEALFFCQRLMDHFIFKDALEMNNRVFKDHHNTYYRFTEEWNDDENVINSYQVHQVSTSNSLNTFHESFYNQMDVFNYDIPMSIASVQLHLSRIMKEICQKFTFIEGKFKLFDYCAFCESPYYSELQHIATKLQKCNISELNANENGKISFFINLYNCMTLHALVRCGFPRNNIQRSKFLKEIYYIIGQYKISLHDIEFSILRQHSTALSNKSPSPINLSFAFPKSKVFATYRDSIHSFLFTRNHEEFMHRQISSISFEEIKLKEYLPELPFMLFKGMISSPSLSYYDHQRLDEQITMQMRDYADRNIEILNKETSKSADIILSELFLPIRDHIMGEKLSFWENEEFQSLKVANISNHDIHLLCYIMNRWMDPEKKNKIMNLLSGQYHVEIMYHYNYDFNHKNYVKSDKEEQDKIAQTNPANIEDKKMEIELDDVIENEKYMSYFRSFCKKEFSEENILFWIDSCAFKQIEDDNQRKTAAHGIYSKYLSPGTAPYELNINQSLVKDVWKKLFPDKAYSVKTVSLSSILSDIEHSTTTNTTESSELPPKSPEENEIYEEIDNEDSENVSQHEMVDKTLFDTVQKNVRLVMFDTFMRFRKNELYTQMLELPDARPPPDEKSRSMSDEKEYFKRMHRVWEIQRRLR